MLKETHSFCKNLTETQFVLNKKDDLLYITVNVVAVYIQICIQYLNLL